MNPVCYLMDTQAAGIAVTSPFAITPAQRVLCLPRCAPPGLACKKSVARSGGKRGRLR